MNAFQIIIVPVLLAAGGYSLWQSAARHKRRLVLLAGVLIAGAACVADPMLAQRAANWLGIGRGADLVAYLTALAVIGAYLVALHGQRKLRSEITELTRQLAIHQADLGQPSSSINDRSTAPKE